jgi:SagB-type dehydrogenase family enzyme
LAFDGSLTVQSSRRDFLRLVGSGLTALSAAAPGVRAETRPLEIHNATRNTLLGALASRLPSFEAAPSPFKAYPGVQRLALPAFASEPALTLVDAAASAPVDRGFTGAALPLGQLSRILHFTNGVTGSGESPGSVLLRAAPSAGALYAGEVYVVAERVQDLAPGIYYYAVQQHELVPVRKGAQLERVAATLSRPAAFAGAAAAILLTNVFRRYSWRYANRGYRYALIDSGHIGENLRLAAASAGLGHVSESRFEDDALNALLQADGREEAVCAVHAIGKRSDRSLPRSGGLRGLAEKGVLAPEKLPRSGSVPARYHEASKLVSAPHHAEPPRAPLRERHEPGREIAPPRPTLRPGATVEETIQRRRSATSFRAPAVRSGELAFALETAQSPQAFEASGGVEIFVAAHRLVDVAPGFYHYRPRAHALVEVRRGDLRADMIRACLRQDKAGQAAIGFFMVGRIADAVARGGPRSYRDLLVESGAIGQRIYLAAEALGLAARNLSAFFDDELNQLLGFDGRTEAVLHLTMFGPGD